MDKDGVIDGDNYRKELKRVMAIPTVQSFNEKPCTGIQKTSKEIDKEKKKN